MRSLEGNENVEYIVDTEIENVNKLVINDDTLQGDYLVEAILSKEIKKIGVFGDFGVGKSSLIKSAINTISDDRLIVITISCLELSGVIKENTQNNELNKLNNAIKARLVVELIKKCTNPTEYNILIGSYNWFKRMYCIISTFSALIFMWLNYYSIQYLNSTNNFNFFESILVNTTYVVLYFITFGIICYSLFKIIETITLKYTFHFSLNFVVTKDLFPSPVEYKNLITDITKELLKNDDKIIVINIEDLDRNLSTKQIFELFDSINTISAIENLKFIVPMWSESYDPRTNDILLLCQEMKPLVGTKLQIL